MDGLRGVAAGIVVLCHFVLAFQPALLSGKAEQGARAAATGLSRTPLVLFWNPDFAVSVFFVLSGFVLAASCGRLLAGRPAAGLLALLLRRWVRLAGPILGSSVLIWAVVAAGWLRNGPAAALNGSDWLAMHFGWLAWQANSLPILVRQSLWDIFANGTHWWNAALWTMPVEFWGSAGVFAGYAVLGRAPGWARVAVAGAALVALAGSNFAGFAAGVLLWEGRGLLAAQGWWTGAALFGLAFALGGMPFDLLGTAYWPGFVWASGWMAEPVLAAHRIGAGLMVMAAMAWPPLRWVLARRAVLALGRVSFMVYLLHVALLCSLASAIVLGLAPAWGYDAATVAALAATAAVLLPLAAGMTRLVDEPAIRLSRWSGAAVLAWPGLARASQRLLSR